MRATQHSILRVGAAATLLFGLCWGLAVFSAKDPHHIAPERLRAVILSFGAWAPGIYLLAYAQPLIPLPGSLMTVAGGLAFGPCRGTLVALTGAWAHACGQFFLARLLGQGGAAGWLRARTASMSQHARGPRAFTAVLLIRLIPNVPVDVQNYGLGFSGIHFGTFAWASLLGMAPASIALAYLGYSLTDLRRVWRLVLAVLLLTGLVMWQRRLASRA